MSTPRTFAGFQKRIWGRDAVRRFTECGVDLVLSGHTRVPGMTLFDGDDQTTVLISAGTLSDRTREDQASFNRLILKSDEATLIRYGFEDGAAVRLETTRIAK
ncbi:MAG: hypothetical protein AAGA88_01720 [Pseudomonadota bacterium]